MNKKHNQSRRSRWKEKNNRFRIRNERLAKHHRLTLEAMYGPAERKRLEILRKDLLALGKIPKDAAGILRFNVKFLDVMSKFQDNGYISYQPISKKYEMDTLNQIILACGRKQDNTGWNRSKKCEKVTIHNVYYGDIYGFSAKPASYWLSRPKSQMVTINSHTALAVDFNSDSSIVSTKTQWITEAIVEAGIDRFTVNNYTLTLDIIEDLLA